MKKRFLLMALTLLSMVIMVSCTKDRTKPSSSITEQTDEQLISQVQWFMNSAKNLEEGKYFKDGEKMYLDSALYFISATLNYKYCFHSENFGKLILDTVYVRIPILEVEDKSFIVDALAGYNEAIEKVRLIFVKLNGDNKKLVGCVVQNKGKETGNFISAISNFTSDKAIVIRVIAQIGIGIASSNPPLVPGEAYWWQRDSWKCDGIGDLGAPNIFEHRLNFKWKPAPPPGYRIWFSSLDIHTFNNPQDYPNPVGGPIDNFCDYKIYYATSLVGGLTDDVKCLGENPLYPGINEMDYYVDGLDNVISEFLYSNRKSYCSLTINSPEIIIPNPYEDVIKHAPILTYGIKHMSYDPTNTFPIVITE
ncbi:MAG: hypothetical protein ACOYMF_14180 [Bacteroidales bacterium]